jgi:hypothetical protein
MFPQVDMNQLGPVGGMMLGDMFNIAKQNNNINQQSALASEQRNQEMHPLDMGFKQAQTGYQDALSRNTNAQADKSIWDLEQDKRLAEPKYQSELAKLQASTSEAEVKQAHAKIEQQLMSKDPTIRKQAEGMYKATGDMLKLYEKARLEKDQAVTVAGMNAAAAKDRASNAAAPRLPRTNQEGLQYWMWQAANTTDPAEQQYAVAMAEQIKRIMMETSNARAPQYVVPGSQNLQVNPNAPGTNTPITVPQKPGVTLPQDGATAGRPARQEAANKPQARSGYVVVYKNGKPVGQVPQGQAELAKKQGYTLE